MKFASRKYVDLIRYATTKWANWDPPVPVQVGDFGYIDRDTGIFQVEGNIYSDMFAPYIPNIKMKDHPPVDAPIEEMRVITTSEVKQSGFNLDPEVFVPAPESPLILADFPALGPRSIIRGIAGILNASVKGEWQFQNGKRGALLVMVKPRATVLPRDILLNTLWAIKELDGKGLITEITTCPAFALYLSDQNEDKISLSLEAKVPAAVAPGVTVGGSAGFNWSASKQSALHRHGTSPDGSYSFVPLFKIVRKRSLIQRLFRDKPSEPEEVWMDAKEPWDILDEEGEEDPVEEEDDEE